MKLELTVGNASRPVILNRDNYEGTIMEEPIESALKIFDRVFRNALKYSSANSERVRSSDFETDWSFKIKNNVIAFLGDRGSGKTSCMLSVENIIRSKDLYQHDLLFMDVIDPSFFDESHNILELFLAQLFHLFSKCSQAELNRDLSNKSRIIEITQKFLELQKNLKYLEKRTDRDDIYDESNVRLDELAAGVYLQSNIRKVVSETLRYYNKKVLVIAIDDLDLNVARAYEMMEQIRKYLIMPEIVILFSAKVDQLKRSVELSLLKTYHDLRDRMNNRIPQMSERYMTKFLPLANRVYMVVPRALMTAELYLKKDDEAGEVMVFNSVSNAVLNLIFRKTRYLFYNIDGNFSYIIPRNLRNLVMLIELLLELPDFAPDVYITTANDDEAMQNLENKNRFKNYIFSDCLNNIDDQDVPIIEDLVSESDMSVFNKVVIDILTNKYGNLLFADTSQSVPKKELANILSTDANPFNLSIGDVLELLEYISNKLIDSNNRNFLFLIRAIYSIKLYECYDLMTDSWNVNPAATEEDIFREYENVDDPKWLRLYPDLNDTRFLDVPDYIKLTGGNFFSFDRIHLLQGARDFRLLNGAFINKKINELIVEYNKAYNAAKRSGEEITLRRGFIDEIRLMEFFILCSAFHVDIREKEIMVALKKSYRRLSIPYYLKPLHGVKNIVFDILKPFFSLIHPEYAYRNFSREFYAICLQLEDNGQKSILRELLYTERRYDGDPKVSIYSDLASRAAIRNMEILTNLYIRLRNRSASIRIQAKDGGLPVMYNELIRYIINKCKVKTYALQEGSDKYQLINFMPFKPLADVLEKVIKCNPRTDLHNAKEKPYTPKTLWEIFQYCFNEDYRDKEAMHIDLISEPKEPATNEPESNEPSTKETATKKSESNEPKRGTEEFQVFTEGYNYSNALIRRIIFNHYPEYKEEYDNEGPIRPLLRKPLLQPMEGSEIVRYLAHISDPFRIFTNTFSRILKSEYDRLINGK